MVVYPALFTNDDEGGYVVTFRDLPEAITEGDSFDEALVMAREVVILALQSRISDRESVPTSSMPQTDEIPISLPSMVDAKLALYSEMRAQQIRPYGLMRLLHTRQASVDRLLNLSHTSGFAVIDEALGAIGTSMAITLQRNT